VKELLEEAVRWNVIVTVVAVSLGYATYWIVGIKVHPSVLVVLGAGTFLVYGLDRRMPFSPEDRVGFHDRRGVPAWALAVDGVVMICACLALSAAARIMVFGLGAFSMAYVMPVLPGRRRMKDIPFVKSALVAMGWATACVLVPLFDAPGAHMGRKAYMLAAYRTLFLLPNAILADWPDRFADQRMGIRTLANSVSSSCLRNACIWIAVIQIVVWGSMVLAGGFSRWTLLENVAPVCLLFILGRPLPDVRLFYLIILDGLMVWPGILAWAAGGH